MSETAAFKECTLCHTAWGDRVQFVTDGELRVEGYIAHFDDPGQGLILVTHRRHGCGTTLAIQADSLRDLYEGPVYVEHRTGSDVCERRCISREDLETCHADCDMVWVREVIQYLHRHELPERLQT